MNNVTLYTDGSCHGNPGAGGYAAMVIFDKLHTKAVSGGDYYTTNNRMELKAVIEGLKLLQIPSKVTIVTDSKYVERQINKGNLREYVNTPGRKNADLWQEILQLSVLHKLSAIWVKGHAGNRYNDKCDRIANEEARRVEKESAARETVFAEILLNGDILKVGTFSEMTGIPVDTVKKYRNMYFEHKRREVI